MPEQQEVIDCKIKHTNHRYSPVSSLFLLLLPSVKIRTFIKIVLVTGILSAGIFTSCEPDELLKDPSARLWFSKDTVTFDTIFTTLGSTTRQLKVYNRYGKTLRISQIRLAGGDQSYFRLNVDGTVSNSISNVEILPHDSLYIFIQVIIDPRNSNSPVLVQDSILFLLNGSQQGVNLEAWGQDMHLIDADTISSSTVWDADKPYVIHNYMIVDSAATLTIQPGVCIYLHRNAVVEVRGTLQTNGTHDQPIAMQGDRLEEDYDDIPGQWGALAFTASSKNNRLEHTYIKNGVVIQVGMLNDSRHVSLTMANCKILNMSYAAIYAFGADIQASNCVFADADNLLLLLKGGNYGFYHCTLSNNGVIFSNRSLPSIVLSNYYYDEDYVEYDGDLVSRFGNCIIWGTMDNEIGISSKSNAGLMDYRFDYCMIHLDPSSISISDTAHFDSVWYTEPPDFKNADTWNFELDSLSFARNRGSLKFATMFPYDFNGVDRLADGYPDLGAFEHVAGDTTKRKKSRP